MTNVADDDLKDLGLMKTTFSSIFLSDPEVTKLVMPVLDDPDFGKRENWDGGTYYLRNESGEVLKEATLPGHCFLVPFLPDAVTDKRTILTMETTISKELSRHLLEIAVDVHIYTHRNFCMADPETAALYAANGYAGSRIDMTAMAVHNALKKQARNYGIGSIRLSGKEPVSILTEDQTFYGKKLTYLCSGSFSGITDGRNL